MARGPPLPAPFPTLPAPFPAPLSAGTLSAYGNAFLANGLKYSLPLACLDSDGDGFPNGWELGDPCGVFVSGAAPLWTNDIAHPGNASSVPLTRKVNWTVCGKNPCVAPEVVVEVEKLQAAVAAMESKAEASKPASGSSLRKQKA